MKPNDYSLIIIDPVSPEFNRGSFCYSPYILYSAMKAGDVNARLIENFCAADLDRLPTADEYLVALWSHPQIEHVKTLVRFLPNCKVFGYTPLIKTLELPLYELTKDEILGGIDCYHLFFHEFKQILLSDCDMHLAQYEGQVYPLFTSYGCPNGCAFCPSTANQPRRLYLSVECVKENLQDMADRDYLNIHFTDEDFFFNTDRAHEIIQFLAKHERNFQLIALAERKTLLRYLNKYGNKDLEAAGFKLLEVGLETASDSLGQNMGKGGLRDCQELISACSVPILWLALTFFPGETIKTLRDTGKFMGTNGFKPQDLYPRIATNGTVGGLGQFFQPYEGTKGFENLGKLGEQITSRPLRLMPSYIPNSFKNDTIYSIRAITKEEEYWYNLYKVSPPCPQPRGKTKIKVKDYIKMFKAQPDINMYIALAISARLGVLNADI